MKCSIQRGLTEIKAEGDQKVTALRDPVKQTFVKHDETTQKLVEEVHGAAKKTAKQKEQAQAKTSRASYARALG